MNKSVLRALALCLTTVFASGYAFAKDDDSSSPGKSTSSGSPGSSSSKYSSTGASSSQSGKSCRISKLMNSSAKTSSGESLGTIQDVVIDPSTGQAQFVVLSLDSSSAGAPGSSSSTTSGIGSTKSTSTGSAVTSGIGSISSSSSGNLVAVPWSLIQQPSSSSSSSDQQITLNVDRTKLQSAPSFSSASWPTMDTTWSQQVYSHFGVDANSSTGAPGSGSSSSSGTNPATPGVPSTPGTPDITPPSPGTGTGVGTPSSGTPSGIK